MRLLALLLLAGCTTGTDVQVVAPAEVLVPWVPCPFDEVTGLPDPTCPQPDPVVFALDVALQHASTSAPAGGDLTITSAWRDISLLPEAVIEDVAPELLDATTPVTYAGAGDPGYFPTFAKLPVDEGGSARVYVWVDFLPTTEAGEVFASTLTVSGGTDQVQIRLVPE